MLSKFCLLHLRDNIRDTSQENKKKRLISHDVNFGSKKARKRIFVVISKGRREKDPTWFQWQHTQDLHTSILFQGKHPCNSWDDSRRWLLLTYGTLKCAGFNLSKVKQYSALGLGLKLVFSNCRVLILRSLSGRLWHESSGDPCR